MKKFRVTYDVELIGWQTYDFCVENIEDMEGLLPEDGEFVEESMDRTHHSVAEIEEVDE